MGLPDDGETDAIAFSTPQTKAVVEGSFSAGDAFSVWGWYTSAAGSNQPFDGVPVTSDGNNWSYTAAYATGCLARSMTFMRCIRPRVSLPLVRRMAPSP